MILNLDFSKVVNIGSLILDKCNISYKHDLFIVEDFSIQDKYYLIDFIKINSRNADNNFIDNNQDVIVLEDIYITDLSLKKDISKQIYSFLQKEGYITNSEYDSSIFDNLDISYFNVRYKYYERNRVIDLEIIKSQVEIFCNYSRYKIINKDKINGLLNTTIVEDISLYNIKKYLKILFFYKKFEFIYSIVYNGY